MDRDFLLNFLIVLAVDNAHIGNFDTKSQRFVDECLNWIEEEYAG